MTQELFGSDLQLETLRAGGSAQRDALEMGNPALTPCRERPGAGSTAGTAMARGRGGWHRMFPFLSIPSAASPHFSTNSPKTTADWLPNAVRHPRLQNELPGDAVKAPLNKPGG